MLNLRITTGLVIPSTTMLSLMLKHPFRGINRNVNVTINIRLFDDRAGIRPTTLNTKWFNVKYLPFGFVYWCAFEFPLISDFIGISRDGGTRRQNEAQE